VIDPEAERRYYLLFCKYAEEVGATEPTLDEYRKRVAGLERVIAESNRRSRTRKEIAAETARLIAIR